MKAEVVNKTDHIVHLYAHDDSIAVPPTRGGRTVTVPVKFVQWREPNPAEIVIVRYLDKYNKPIAKPPNPTTVKGRKLIAETAAKATKAETNKPSEPHN